MTSLADFSEFYLRMIWRTGDEDLTADLPRLIKQAEARISRDLRDSRISTITVVVIGPGEDSAQIPADFKELISVSFVDSRLARAISYDALKSVRRQPRNYRAANLLYYTIHGGAIHVANWDDDTLTIELAYYTGIQPFPTTDDVESFYDRHPDFFVAALNSEVYTYLRDFELSTEYNGRYLALLEDFRRESNYVAYPSGQLMTPLSSLVK